MCTKITNLIQLYFQTFVDSETQTDECAGCKDLSTKNKRLRSSLKSAKFKLTQERLAPKSNKGITPNPNILEPNFVLLGS